MENTYLFVTASCYAENSSPMVAQNAVGPLRERDLYKAILRLHQARLSAETSISRGKNQIKWFDGNSYQPK